MAEPTLAMMVLEFVLLTDRLARYCTRQQESTKQHLPPPAPRLSRRLPPPSENDSLDEMQQMRPRPHIH